MELAHTRAIISAILDGSMDSVEYETEPYFGLSIPKHVPNVPDVELQPRQTWDLKEGYDTAARELAVKFDENYKQYTHVNLD